MTLQQFLAMIPEALALHTGSKVDKSKRNAFENLYQLQEALKKFMQGGIYRDMSQEAKEKIASIQQTVYNITKVAAGRTSSPNDSVIAEQALGSGSLEQDFAWLQNTLKAEKTKVGMKADFDQLDELEDMVQRAGAGMEMTNLELKPGYAENAKAINDGFRAISEAAEQQKAQKAHEKQQAQQEVENTRQDLIGSGLWHQGQGEITASRYLEGIIRKMRSPEFLTMGEEEQRKVATALLAARAAVDADRGNKNGHLSRTLNYDIFSKLYRSYMNNASLQSLMKNLNMNGGADFQNLVKGRTHGGAFEDKLTSVINKRITIEEDLPSRLMPTLRQRSEYFKKEIKEGMLDVYSDGFLKQIAAIIATREAVVAKRNDSAALDMKPDTKELRSMTTALFEDPDFKKFVQEYGPALKDACGKRGHGGAMLDMYRQYLAKQPEVPEKKNYYLPTVGERIKGLQSQIKSRSFAALSVEKQKELYIELLAARTVGNVIGSNADDLNRKLLYGDLQKAKENLKNSKFIDNVLNVGIQKGDLPKNILKGTGDKFEDQIYETIKVAHDDLIRHKTDVIPDAPDRYMRVRQFDSKLFSDVSEKKVNLNKEIKVINEELDDLLNANDKALNGYTLAEEQVIKSAAARSMLITTEYQKSHNVEIELTQSKFNDQADIICGSEQFQKMVDNVGIGKLAELTRKGGSYVLQEFNKAQKELEGPDEMEFIVDGKVTDINNIKEEQPIIELK